jgi:hypothetical protein
MNLENVKQRTRGTKTLDTHRREIENLVLWFYDNMSNLIGEESRVILKLNDNKKYLEDNDGVETERSNISERLMRRQIELMIGKMQWNELGS